MSPGSVVLPWSPSSLALDCCSSSCCEPSSPPPGCSSMYLRILPLSASVRCPVRLARPTASWCTPRMRPTARFDSPARVFSHSSSRSRARCFPCFHPFLSSSSGSKSRTRDPKRVCATPFRAVTGIPDVPLRGGTCVYPAATRCRRIRFIMCHVHISRTGSMCHPGGTCPGYFLRILAYEFL